MNGKLFSRMELPFTNNKIQIFSDGNDDYIFTLFEYYTDTYIDYGQIVKIREKGTTNIENFNGIMRERVGRLVGKTECFSKKKSRIRNATELIQFYWNFQ